MSKKEEKQEEVLHSLDEMMPDVSGVIDNEENETEEVVDEETGNEESSLHDETKIEKEETDETIELNNEDEEDSDEDNQEDEDAPSIDDNTSSELLKLFAAVYQEKGILPNLEVDKLEGLSSDETIEALSTALEEEKNKGVQEGIVDVLSALPEEIRDVVDKALQGVPADKLFSIRNEGISLSKIKPEDLENEDNESVRRNILETYYKKTTKFSDQKINKEIERKIQLGTDIEDSMEALDELQEVIKEEEKQVEESAKKQREQRQKQFEETRKAVDNYIDETKEVIKDVNIPSAIKKKVKEYMFNPVEFTKDNKPVSYIDKIRTKDPISFNFRLNYYAALGLFDEGVVNPKQLTQTMESNVTKKIKDKLNRTGSFSNKRSMKDESNKVNNLRSGIDDLLKQMK